MNFFTRSIYSTHREFYPIFVPDLNRMLKVYTKTFLCVQELVFDNKTRPLDRIFNFALVE